MKQPFKKMETEGKQQGLKITITTGFLEKNLQAKIEVEFFSLKNELQFVKKRSLN